VADTVVDTVGSAAAATGDVIGAVGTAVDTATFGAASGVLDIVDNTVLDAVDAATGGLIDVDFDDGNLSASVGVDGIVHVGAAVGEDGVTHSVDLIHQSYDIGLTDDGLNASGRAGIDWGPLPFAEGDVTVESDGDLAASGQIQGTVPTPWGMLSGHAEAEVLRNDEMWGASLDADGSLLRPDGSVIRGGIDASYVETADGSALSLGVEGSYTHPGVGTVGGSLGYDRLETGGIVVEQFEAEAYASGYGVKVDAGVEYASVSTPEGSASSWDVSGDLSSAPVGAAPVEPPTEFESAIAAADDVEVSVDEMFSDLG
jgi:hypothetical protein